MDLSCWYLRALFPIRKFIFLFEVQRSVFRSGVSVLNAVIHSIHSIFCLGPFLSYQLYSSNPMRENTIKAFYVRERLFEENIADSCTSHTGTTLNNIAKGIYNCLLLTGSLCPDSVEETYLCFSLTGWFFCNSNSTLKLLKFFLSIVWKKKIEQFRTQKILIKRKDLSVENSSRNSPEKTEDNEM